MQVLRHVYFYLFFFHFFNSVSLYPLICASYTAGETRFNNAFIRRVDAVRCCYCSASIYSIHRVPVSVVCECGDVCFQSKSRLERVPNSKSTRLYGIYAFIATELHCLCSFHIRYCALCTYHQHAANKRMTIQK